MGIPAGVARCLALVFIAFLGGSLPGAPLAPTDMKVSDTQTWRGVNAGQQSLQGVSRHPWFAVTHAGLPTDPAVTHLRIQVGLDAEFASLSWDSGFVPVATTASRMPVPALIYGGTPLAFGTTYYWRAAVKDATGAASSFTTTGSSFRTVNGLQACDLRLQYTTSLSPVQGNPVPISLPTPSFAAEFDGPNGAIALGARVQFSTSNSFEPVTWTSDFVAAAPVTPGQRGPAIDLSMGPAVSLRARTTYFWRYQFAESEQTPFAWSAGPASFVYSPANVLPPAPGGFNRTASSFGMPQGSAGLVVDQFDSGPELDVVQLSPSAGMSHLMVPGFAGAGQQAPLPFGCAAGGRAIAASLDMNHDELRDVVVADQSGICLYINTGAGHFELTGFSAGTGAEPAALCVADVDWDGFDDLAVAWGNELRVYSAINGTPCVCHVASCLGAVKDLAYLAPTEKSAPCLLVLSSDLAGIQAYGGEYWQSGQWDCEDAQAMASIPHAPEELTRQVAFASSTQAAIKAIDINDAWTTVSMVELPYHGPCTDLAIGDLNGDTKIDLVVAQRLMVYSLHASGQTFTPGELVGTPGEQEVSCVALADATGDGNLDVAVAFHDSAACVYTNSQRLTASVLPAVALQSDLGEAWIEFPVVLDAPPVEAVEVYCETGLEPPGGADGDGDELANLGDALRGQTSQGYAQTSARLLFLPGQTSAMFRVRLTAPAAGVLSFTLTAQIVSAIGASIGTQTATGTVHAAGAGTSGAPATSGQQRDWRIRGEVHAIARAAGNTYFGGQFDGVEWDASGAATIDETGNRRYSLPPVSGSVFAVAMYQDGSIFVGGQFATTFQGQQIQNIGKLNPQGQWDLNFRPNPNGPVNAIAFSNWGEVYFGGNFDALGNVAGAFRNIAVLPVHTHVSATNANRFKVWQVNASGVTTSAGTVQALKFANSGIAGSDYLLVGGTYLNRAQGVSGGATTISNLAMFSPNGSYCAGMPLVQGPVSAIAVSVSSFGSMYSNTIVFGGQFTQVIFGGSYGTRSYSNIGTTNFLGQADTTATTLYSASAVCTLLVDASNLLWVGRGSAGPSGPVDPLALYIIQGGKLVPQAFASGLDGPVRGLAEGNSCVVAVGGFTHRFGAPAGRMASWSLSPPYGAKPSFRTSLNGQAWTITSGRASSGSLIGLAVGGTFTSLIADRGNLAAMTAAGELLPWGPRTNGVVNALVSDGTRMYFGGAFTQVTGTGLQQRAGLASVLIAPSVVDVDAWNVPVAGGGSTVYALDLSGTSLLVAGDFTSVAGVPRSAVAAVSTLAGGSASVDSAWNPDPVSGAGIAVYSVVRDGSRTYLGGTFHAFHAGAGTASRVSLAAVASPGAGSSGALEPWDAQLGAGTVVRAIALSANEVFVGGDLNTVGGLARGDVAACLKSNAAATAFAPDIQGVYSLSAAPAGPVYAGGSFQHCGTQPRLGVAAFDLSGLLLDWNAPLLGTGQPEQVRALHPDTLGATAVIWVGGNFTGLVHTGQHCLTALTTAWYVATPALPAAHENQTYGPVVAALSEPVAVTWSISSVAAPWLSIDPVSGAVSGFAPLGAPAQMPVLVTATQTVAPFGVATKWFVISLIPVPPPTTVSLSGPTSVLEGDSVHVCDWQATLNQPFSQDVLVHVEIVAGTAVAGTHFALLDAQVMIPQMQMTADIRVAVFGNTTLDSSRAFAIRLTSLTQNVAANPLQNQVGVTILDDDPPLPRDAFVRQLAVRESPTLAGNPARIVADQPWVTWAFGTDVPGNMQATWQVQLFDNAALAGQPLWDSGTQAGSTRVAQAGVALPDGANLFARLRLWAATGNPSDWATFAFHTNARPPAPGPGFAPTGTSATSLPTFQWGTLPDIDGDDVQFELTLTHPTAGPWVLDSAIDASCFEQQIGGSWVALYQSGASPLATAVRAAVPARLSLVAGNWTWSVVARDGFECSIPSPVQALNIAPALIVSGTLHDAAGLPESGRTITVAALPGYVTLATGVTGSNGSFQIPVLGNHAPGGLLVAFADANGATAPAASYFRNPGHDLTAAQGTTGALDLKHGMVRVESRGASAITLKELESSAVPGLPFLLSTNALELKADFTEMAIDGSFEIEGPGVSSGQPVCLKLLQNANGQMLITADGSSLWLDSGASIEAFAMRCEGDLTLAAGASLTCQHESSSAAAFVMGSTAHLNLPGVTWKALSGHVFLDGAIIDGVSAEGSLVCVEAVIDVTSAKLVRSSLVLQPQCSPATLQNISFEGVLSVAAVSWNVQQPLACHFTGARFDGMAQSNVAANGGASLLEMRGCGGPGCGEAFDSDPGEATANDIVVWISESIQDLVAVAADQKVLLMWGSAQTGGASFEVLSGASAQGPFQAVGSTVENYYVETGLPNGQLRYYVVRVASGPSVGADSNVAVASPRAPEVLHQSPMSILPTDYVPGVVLASDAHFGTLTTLLCNYANAAIPASSVMSLSPTLLIFDIETVNAAPGSAPCQIDTAEIWSEVGVTGYPETVLFTIEVSPPPSQVRPTIELVSTAGGVEQDTATDGAFHIDVLFHDEGGAPINPATFECVVDRDIEVCGQAVPASTNLACAPYPQWTNITATGADWFVEQQFSATDPQKEVITRGEIIIRMRVANQYGLSSDWTDLRVLVDGGGSDTAFASTKLRQGRGNQTVFITGNNLGDADLVEFPNDSEIQVQSITVHQDPNASMPGRIYYDESGKPLLPTVAVTQSIEVVVDVGENAKIGREAFVVRKQATGQTVATGSYWVTYDFSHFNAPDAYPDPMSAVDANNVILQNGEFVWSVTDIATRSAAFPVVWDRTYRSSRSEESTILGKGWFGTYTQYLIVEDSDARRMWWINARGDKLQFGPLSDPGSWTIITHYDVPYGIAAQVVVAEHVDHNKLTVKRIRITTAEGRTFTFARTTDSIPSQASTHKFRLEEVCDSFRNTHRLEYECDGRLASISSDTCNDGRQYGEVLDLEYHDNGLVDNISRRVVETSPPRVITQTFECISYKFSADKRLTLQRMTTGHREGERYNGCVYGSVPSTQGQLLKDVYAPSQCKAFIGNGHLGNVDVAQSAVPALRVDYAYATGPFGPECRVTGQHTPAGTGALQPWRDWSITYLDPPASSLPQRWVGLPDGSGHAHILNSNGQPLQSIVSGGGQGVSTSFEYHPQTRATLKVVLPNGNAIYNTYAPGPKNTQSLYTFAGLATDPSNPFRVFSALYCPGIVNLQDYVNCQCELTLPTGLSRFSIVEGAGAGGIPAGSIGPILFVFGDVRDAGLATGTVTIYKRNSDSLSRYHIVQQRRCETTAWSPHDLITTTTVLETDHLGLPTLQTPASVDEQGNVTSTTSFPLAAWLPPNCRPAVLSQTVRWFRQLNESGVLVQRKARSYRQMDPRGRPSYEWSWQTLTSDNSSVSADYDGQTKITHEYYDDNLVTAGYIGQLKTVTVAKEGAGFDSYTPQQIITEYAYDYRGNAVQVRQPRFQNPGMYGSNLFVPTCYYNIAGQMYRKIEPAVGSPSNPARRETWYYYDKDGRVVREVASWEPSFGYALPAPPADVQNEPDLNDLPIQFPAPTSRTAAGWLISKYEYDPRTGELVSQESPVDVGVTATTSFAYDSMGRRTTVIDPDSRRTECEYDYRGLLVAEVAAPGTSVEGRTTYTYDGNGNLITETSPGGVSVQYNYDGFDRRTDTLAPAASGLLLHQVEYPKPLEPNIVKESTWGASLKPRKIWTHLDELGRPWRVSERACQADGQTALAGACSDAGTHWAVTEYSLDASGEVEAWRSATEGTSSRTKLRRDRRGLCGWPIMLTRGSDVMTDQFYDEAGNVIKSSTPYVHWINSTPRRDYAVTDTEYDPSNLPWKVTGPQGHSTLLIRNTDGLVEQTIDGQGRTHHTEYNFAGQPRRQSVMDGSVESLATETTYSPAGLTLSESASTGQIPILTTYTYDARGRLETTRRGTFGTWTNAYDADSRLIAVTRPDGSVENNSYDNAGNLVARIVTQGLIAPPGSGVIGTTPFIEKATFSYNEFGECTKAVTFNASEMPQTELTMQYNTLGLIETQTLRVFDQAGNAIAVHDNGHIYAASELGFESKYYATSRTASNWTMSRGYDCAGREVATGFWDGRTLTTRYHGLDPWRVFDHSLEASSHVLLEYSFEQGLLSQRQNHSAWAGNVHHVRSPRPLSPAGLQPASVGMGQACSYTRISSSERGELESVTHLHAKPGSLNLLNFAGVEMNYDRSGNPVVERRLHQGGLTRVMGYDFAGRLESTYRGHLISLASNPLIDTTDLGTTSPYLTPAAGISYQSRRDYSQDDADNITGCNESLSLPTGNRPQEARAAGLVQDDRSLLHNFTSSNRTSPGDFDYDAMGRVKFDPTTGLEYEYNAFGQVALIKSGGAVLRRNTYDAFARLVHQQENPGTQAMRGTIFVPNVGFGGEGEGADTAAEVSYFDNGQPEAIDIVQFTSGLGAEGGGLGMRRCVELVAYCREGAPYYRFLHEDALGSTIAVTSLWGDRLDEYDYTDYGAPMHAPVALDGRWVQSVSAGGDDRTIVTLAQDVLSPNELIGCEFRVVDYTPGGADDVFCSATVMSHLGTSVTLLDPGHELWYAYHQQTLQLSAFYDLREGSQRGKPDSAVTGLYTGNGWYNEPCTRVIVNQGPFGGGMYTQPTDTNPLYCEVGPDAQGNSISVIVLGTEAPVTGAGYTALVLAGDQTAWLNGPDSTYTVDGRKRITSVARAGQWAQAAISVATAGGTTTDFTLGSMVGLTQEMVGWVIQPDINVQAFGTITGIDKDHSRVTADGQFDDIVQAGHRWRILAPPATVTHGAGAGTGADFDADLSWVGAQDTHCLFAQYRFEIPLAGARVYTGGTTAQTLYRQPGLNFTGQYYTLHRHYDPFTMRWTSPDPAAQFFFNLYGYAGNNPARTADPDGDWILLLPAAMTLAIVGGAIYDGIANDGATVKEVAGRTWTGFRTVVQCPAQTYNHYGRGDAEPELTQGYRQMGQAYESRQQLLEAGGESRAVSRIYAGLLAAGDVTGATGVSEFLTRTDSVTGTGLTAQEARVRGILGAGAMGMSAIGGAGMLNLSRGLATKAGSGVASLARSFASMDRGLPVSRLRAGRAGMIRIMPGESLPNGFQPFKPSRPPRHHLFPKDFRAWFEARGVKIDKYTYELTPGHHSAIHTAGFNKYWEDFIALETGKGRHYAPREIMRWGVRAKREFQITGRHMPYRD